MGIPSGSGTEVPKAVYMHALTNSVKTLISGDANKIRTVLSVVFTEMDGNAESFNMYIDAGYADVAGVSSTDIYLLHLASVGERETFVYNDRFVVYGLDALKVEVPAGGNVDVHCSFIEQDWS
jgi:hypothetical protein